MKHTNVIGMFITSSSLKNKYFFLQWNKTTVVCPKTHYSKVYHLAPCPQCCLSESLWSDSYFNYLVNEIFVKGKPFPCFKINLQLIFLLLIDQTVITRKVLFGGWLLPERQMVNKMFFDFRKSAQVFSLFLTACDTFDKGLFSVLNCRPLSWKNFLTTTTPICCRVEGWFIRQSGSQQQLPIPHNLSHYTLRSSPTRCLFFMLRQHSEDVQLHHLLVTVSRGKCIITVYNRINNIQMCPEVLSRITIFHKINVDR